VYYQIFFPNFDMISTRVMHSNQNMLNGITVRFKTNVAIPVGGSILIKFPRVNQSTASIKSGNPSL
jgi:hypothetical protein